MSIHEQKYTRLKKKGNHQKQRYCKLELCAVFVNMFHFSWIIDFFSNRRKSDDKGKSDLCQ